MNKKTKTVEINRRLVESCTKNDFKDQSLHHHWIPENQYRTWFWGLYKTLEYEAGYYNSYSWCFSYTPTSNSIPDWAVLREGKIFEKPSVVWRMVSGEEYKKHFDTIELAEEFMNNLKTEEGYFYIEL